MKVIISIWLTAAMMIFAVGRLHAQAPDPTPDLTTATLEELMNIEVTSVSKKEEQLFQAAAAVYVITREDIRRSGLTSLPELFRLVPGMDVARIDGNKWAISVRGFNRRFVDKLLVLVDGRTVYSPHFSGVFWEAQQPPLEEIERIEVIRGPGGTLWGANAVNGVINIITKHAKDSQGGLMTAGGGSEEQGFASARYGGMIGAHAHYRAYARYFNRSGLVNAAGFNAHDWQNWVSGGWRVDWKRSERDALTVQAEIYDTGLRETQTTINLAAPFAPPALSPGDLSGGNVLGRWDHIFSDRSDTTLQIYFNRLRRTVYDVREHEDTFDVDFQHHLTLGRQDLVWGLGYRVTSDRLDDGVSAQYIPKERDAQLFSGFVQDELTLIQNRLRLTLGSKLEHHDYTHFEVQPSARLLWTPSDRQTVWAAVSRAVRTPSRVERGIRFKIAAFPGPEGLPGILTVVGNPNTRSEELRAYELGYRAKPGRRLSLDISTFYNFYDRLQSITDGPPYFDSNPLPHLVIPASFDNQLRGRTYGLEAFIDLKIAKRWKCRGGYSYLGAQLNHKLSAPDINIDLFEGNSPRHQFQIHSYLTLPRNFELDSSLYHVSRLPTPQISSYTRLDARFGWKVRERLELSLGLQNLLEDRHSEYRSIDTFVIPSEVRRSFYGQATWRF